MKKRVLFAIVILFVVSQFVFSASNEKLEYMVVSFGKANFSQLRSKAMAYWDDGISKGTYGASHYEEDLDILGQHGWEVATILGAIGGDQQVMLKRPYDKSRTDAEIKEVEKNSALALQGLLGSLMKQDEAKAATELVVKEPELIELDSLEARQKKEREEVKSSEQLTQIAKTYVNSLTKYKPIDWSVSYSNFKYTNSKIFLTFDITKDYLLNENTYRKSQVDGFLKSFDSTLKNIPQLDGKDIDIGLTANIIYSGKTFKVGSATYSKGVYSEERYIKID